MVSEREGGGRERREQKETATSEASSRETPGSCFLHKERSGTSAASKKQPTTPTLFPCKKYLWLLSSPHSASLLFYNLSRLRPCSPTHGIVVGSWLNTEKWIVLDLCNTPRTGETVRRAQGERMARLRPTKWMRCGRFGWERRLD